MKSTRWLRCTWMLLAVLPRLAAADAPPDRYTTSAETVHDRRTALTWQRSSTEFFGFEAEAATYCRYLVLGGHDDWRIPTIAELLSIVDASRANPAIDSVAFPTTPNAPFLSATPFAAGPSAWCVDFRDGSTTRCIEFWIQSEFIDGGRVRCVR